MPLAGITHSALGFRDLRLLLDAIKQLRIGDEELMPEIGSCGQFVTSSLREEVPVARASGSHVGADPAEI